MIAIDGRARADAMLARIATDVASRLARGGTTPCLAVVLVGSDPASGVYVRRKAEALARVGMRSVVVAMDGDATEEAVLSAVRDLNADRGVHGVLVQLPLPPGVDPARVMDAIDPAKDVDGFHPVNVGRLSVGGGLVPCTPLGCLALIDSVVPDLRGLDAVVIGKSTIVGKPIAMLLLDRECTVTVTHVLTRDLPAIARRADLLVAAAGVPGLVRGDWVRPGAVVVDVGINRVVGPDGRSRLLGDVAWDEIGHAAAATPVPGGVGPMTVACLVANTMAAAERSDPAFRPLQK